MRSEELESLVREGLRTPLWKPDPANQEVAYGQDDVKRIIPHRDPFLFVDEIVGVNLVQSCIRGFRTISSQDPVFRGHVPEAPIYPGVLHIETMGQLALCLIYFHAVGSARISPDVRLERLLAFRIHHGVLQNALLPGDRLEVHARLLDDDDLTVTFEGQILKNGGICSYGVMELIYVDR
jgi:3-hydroxymyristoyl/3-hydroxydecanoyl-(acyl carrier protein) dehydratase